MAFLDSTGEQTLDRNDFVIVADFGRYRLGKVIKVMMAQESSTLWFPLCAVHFEGDLAPVLYRCDKVTKLTSVGSDQWVRIDCVAPDGLPKSGDEIMVLSKKRHYSLAKFKSIDGGKVRFSIDGENFITTQEYAFVRFIIGDIQ